VMDHMIRDLYFCGPFGFFIGLWIVSG
jgi:hypothetical protein